MTVKIKKLGPEGHQALNLTREEANKMIELDKARYFVVSDKTGRVLRGVKIRDGQTLTMIPVVQGGS